jgi:hypothetical protein
VCVCVASSQNRRSILIDGSEHGSEDCGVEVEEEGRPEKEITAKLSWTILNAS